MSAALIGVIERYQELVKLITGKMPRLHSAKTPFLQEDTREAPARAPKNDEDFVECPHCFHTVSTSDLDSVMD